MTVAVAGRRSATSLAIRDAEKAARGSLVVESKVVEKVAAQLAAGVRGVGAPAGGSAVTGGRRWPGRGASAVPRVRATLRDGRADLDVEVTLRYPEPLTETCQRLSSRLRAAVPQLTGITVERIDILASGMDRGNGAGGRR
jgi:uncharacterized alkaline shock family protein YloU